MSKETGFRNIGPVSMDWLRAVGVNTVEDLRKIGAVRTYKRIKEKGFNATLNLLYALEGAIHDLPWHGLSHATKKN